RAARRVRRLRPGADAGRGRPAARQAGRPRRAAEEVIIGPTVATDGTSGNLVRDKRGKLRELGVKERPCRIYTRRGEYGGHRVERPRRLPESLASNQVPFQALLLPPAFSAQQRAKHLHLSGRQVAKCVLLMTPGGPLLAVLPATHHIDLLALGLQLGDAVRLA